MFNNYRSKLCDSKKVSQHWFREKERLWATTIMLLANNIGGIIGLGLTPIIVPTAQKVPLMNILWFIPSAIGVVLTIFKVYIIECLNPLKNLTL